jgi:hypothetical protein
VALAKKRRPVPPTTKLLNSLLPIGEFAATILD